MSALKVLYFGYTADISATKEEYISYVQDLNSCIALLVSKYPKLKESKYKLALNGKIIDTNTSLKDTDEIALLPPFSGG